MVPLPRVPRSVPYVAAGVWLSLVVLSALVGSDKSFIGRLILLILGTVAPVAFAAAGGALVVERWQRREWERRTRYIVATLVDNSLDILCSLAATTYGVITNALPEHQRHRVSSLHSAFRIPLGDMQISSMQAAAVIVKGMSAALADAVHETTSTVVAALSLEGELRAQKMHALEVRHQRMLDELAEYDKKWGTNFSGPAQSSEAREGIPQPFADDAPLEADPVYEERKSQYEASSTDEFPEGTLPFKIEPNAALKRELILRYAAIPAEYDRNTSKLCKLITDLSAYVPAQSLCLVETALSLRQNVSTRHLARVPEAQSSSPSKSPEDQPSNKQGDAGGVGATAETLEEEVQGLLKEAERIASETREAWTIVAWVLDLFINIFKLLQALDEVYRIRYSGPSRGIHRLPIILREDFNAHFDYLDAVINHLDAARAQRMEAHTPSLDSDPLQGTGG